MLNDKPRGATAPTTIYQPSTAQTVTTPADGSGPHTREDEIFMGTLVELDSDLVPVLDYTAQVHGADAFRALLRTIPVLLRLESETDPTDEDSIPVVVPAASDLRCALQMVIDSIFGRDDRRAFIAFPDDDPNVVVVPDHIWPVEEDDGPDVVASPTIH